MTKLNLSRFSFFSTQLRLTVLHLQREKCLIQTKYGFHPTARSSLQRSLKQPLKDSRSQRHCAAGQGMAVSPYCPGKPRHSLTSTAWGRAPGCPSIPSWIQIPTARPVRTDPPRTDPRGTPCLQLSAGTFLADPLRHNGRVPSFTCSFLGC